MNLILFGPPGSGKTSVGRICAQQLGWTLVDTDELIASRANKSIAEIFSEQGEATFRAQEQKVIADVAATENAVVAVGGGALADPDNRRLLEAQGIVVCLRAGAGTIVQRLQRTRDRPLLAGDLRENVVALLQQRESLYDSFHLQIATDNRTAVAVAQDVVAVLPSRIEISHPQGAYTLAIGAGVRKHLHALLGSRGISLPQAIVTDDTIAPLWADALGMALAAPVIAFPAGEVHKTVDTVQSLCSAFLKHGLDRRSVVLTLGGGVVGDVAGFAAATYMRGIQWVNMPTTVLAMVDASIGGKVGVDLPQGKNLMGAFHPPAMIVSDPELLSTLPSADYTSGLAEVVKHGIIADPELFDQLPEVLPLSGEMLQRAMQVKIDIVQGDPFELGEREILNLGHTIGHGIEAASGYRLRHGEAISIGMVAEARLAEQLGKAESGLSEKIAATLHDLDLPVQAQDLDPQLIRRIMQADKKKHAGQLQFALPVAIGTVEYGLTAPDDMLRDIIESVSG